MRPPSLLNFEPCIVFVSLLLWKLAWIIMDWLKILLLLLFYFLIFFSFWGMLNKSFRMTNVCVCFKSIIVNNVPFMFKPVTVGLRGNCKVHIPLRNQMVWDIYGPGLGMVWAKLWPIYVYDNFMGLIWAIAFHSKPIPSHCLELTVILLSLPMGLLPIWQKTIHSP